jgi:phage FluMu protein Com
MLLHLVESKKIRDETFEFLANSKITGCEIGYILLMCPKCMHLANRFYFKLDSPTGVYKPEYECDECQTSLQPVDFKAKKDLLFEIIDENKHKAEWKCPDCGNDHLVYDDEVLSGD